MSSSKLFSSLNFSPRTSFYSRSHYEYLCAVNEAGTEELRNILEDWYSKIPSSAKKDIKNRFCSEDEIQHQGAYFELLIHQLSLKHGYSLSPHPNLEHSSYKPDFSAQSTDGLDFFLEVNVPQLVTTQKSNMSKEANRLLDDLNKHINSSAWRVGAQVIETTQRTPSARRIAAEVTEHLSLLEANQAAPKNTSLSTKSPELIVQQNGWKIRFFFSPSEYNRAVSGISSTLRSYDSRDRCVRLRKALRDKSKKYGRPGKPIVLALNTPVHFSSKEIEEVLLGDEIYTFNPDNSNIYRKSNGFWNPKVEHISAVILGRNLEIWNLKEARLCVYHNPNAKINLPKLFHRLPYSMLGRDGRLEEISGETPHQICVSISE